MAGKAKERKTFGNKLKDQQEQNKTLYSLASQGTITQSQGGSIVSGSGSGSSGGVFQVSETDLDMNTYDITNVDRLKFAAKSGASDALTANDYGIEAIFTSNTAYGLQIRIPEQSSDTFKIYRGTQEEVSISQAGIIFFDHVTIASGNARKPKLVLAQYDSSATPANPKSGTRTLFVDGTNSDNLSVKKSDGTVIDLESTSGWVGTATSDLNMAGNDIDNVTQLEFGQSATSGGTISNSTDGIIYDTHSSSDEHYLRVDGNSKFVVGNTVNTSLEPLDMSGEGISNCGHVYFNSSGTNDSYIDGLSTGLNFNVPTGDEYRFYFNSSLKWSITDSQISGNNIILGNTLTMNDNSSDPAGNGQIARNGNYLRVQTKGIVKDLTCVSGYKDSATSQSTGTNTTLDGWFGDQNGCIGVQYDSSSSAGSGKYRIWIRADGGWYKAEAY